MTANHLTPSPRDAPVRLLRLMRPGLDTYQENVVYLRHDSEVVRSEGFSAQARVEVSLDARSIIATLNVVRSDLLANDEAALSEAAFRLLGAREGDLIRVRHPAPVASLSHVRSKVYGHRLDDDAMRAIVADVVAGRYADVHVASFVTACAGNRLERDEMVALTRAMVEVGQRLDWGRTPVVDKHCVGGLPGNRTTLLVVPIVAAAGLTIPKTSSRAITSPAGTADTMATLAPVELDTATMRRVVEREGGCIAWGGAVGLSPADDLLIRVERALEIDSEGQLVASVLSKKVAAGSTHVVLDLPVGPTVKVRTPEAATHLAAHLEAVGAAVGLVVRTIVTDGSQPVGRGIGPALEARDVLSVLQGAPDAPRDLRERALLLAGAVLEVAGSHAAGTGRETARQVLDDGRAWAKFQAICHAQGGMRSPPSASYRQAVRAARTGRVLSIDNRKLARVAKLAGAPLDAAAGLELHVPAGAAVETGQALFTVHAEHEGELEYALQYVRAEEGLFRIEDA